MRFLLILLCLTFASPAWAGSKAKSEVNRHIESLVVRIEEAYQTLENAQYRNSIAVFDLADDSPQAATRNLGMACSQFLTTRLSQTGKFYVVERVTLQKVIDEMKLGMTGLVDEATAAKAGKIVGADIIVVGSVSEVGEYFNVNIRLVEVETAHLLVSAVEEVPRDLLIESAGTFRPPSYRVGISVHMFSKKEDELGGVPPRQKWLGVFYSKDLKGRFVADIECGWTFVGGLGDEEEILNEYTQNLYVKNGPFVSARIHWALVDTRPVRITTHAGLITFRPRYAYSTWDYVDERNYVGVSDYGVMLSAPLGMSLYLQPPSVFSFRLDFDYLAPVKELVVRYPGEPRPRVPLRPLSVSISGPTASASLVMYF